MSLGVVELVGRGCLLFARVEIGVTKFPPKKTKPMFALLRIAEGERAAQPSREPKRGPNSLGKSEKKPTKCP